MKTFTINNSNKFIVLIVLLLSFNLAFSQQQRHEKIRALKTAFITDELDLTPSEAEKFWPVYNQYENKIRDLKRKERKALQNKLNVNNRINELSEEEATSILSKINQAKEKQFLIEKEKQTALQKVISAKKILKLYEAERKFHRQLLNQLKEHDRR